MKTFISVITDRVSPPRAADALGPEGAGEEALRDADEGHLLRALRRRRGHAAHPAHAGEAQVRTDDALLYYTIFFFLNVYSD